jgi:hypothetical protein
MRWKLACGSLALAVLLLAQSAHAITQLFALTRSCFTITAGTTCDFAPMESGPGASSSIDRLYGGNFLTHAGLVVPDWDSFGANVRASADYADPFGAFALSATGRTTARYRDTLTVSGGTGSGSLRFTWHVEGSNTIEWAASPDITNVTANVTLDILCVSGTRQCFSPHHAWTTSGVIDETIIVDIPILFGVPTETLQEIDLAANFGYATGNPCTGACITTLIGSVTGSFGATGTLIDVQVFDSGGFELAPSLIQSESGFRYDLVPEPSVMALAGAAVLLNRVRRAGARRRAREIQRLGNTASMETSEVFRPPSRPAPPRRPSPCGSGRASARRRGGTRRRNGPSGRARAR